MRYLEEHGIGFAIGPVRVPILAGAVIFDLLAGDPAVRPGAEAGYAACGALTRAPELGGLGAGTGATVAKAGDGSEMPTGGVGVASAPAGDATVAAVMVANGVGGCCGTTKVRNGSLRSRPGTITRCCSRAPIRRSAAS